MLMPRPPSSGDDTDDERGRTQRRQQGAGDRQGTLVSDVREQADRAEREHDLQSTHRPAHPPGDAHRSDGFRDRRVGPAPGVGGPVRGLGRRHSRSWRYGDEQDWAVGVVDQF